MQLSDQGFLSIEKIGHRGHRDKLRRFFAAIEKDFEMQNDVCMHIQRVISQLLLAFIMGF